MTKCEPYCVWPTFLLMLQHDAAGNLAPISAIIPTIGVSLLSLIPIIRRGADGSAREAAVARASSRQAACAVGADFELALRRPRHIIVARPAQWQRKILLAAAGPRYLSTINACGECAPGQYRCLQQWFLVIDVDNRLEAK